ncbi:YagK/YfjJ domain-containing protein [Deefgea piscis]|uniref:YagK/YfjJ domain-containing protein n=1 Tax=Deefgea piscis TaxID=2739061 RepID=UPI00210513D7|nr:inovirus-type Gp2 protein [Deefgea piscis]
MKRADFKTRCDQWFTQSSNSFRSTKTYIEYLFERYARLLVIRLDFGFRVGSELRSDLLQCRECFQRMLNNREHNSLFKNQVGYIWRLEYGEKKGWHYHCIFFFDGSKSRQDITLGDEIGSYWMNAITKGQGTYWNCNRHKERYELFKTLGVGMVYYKDELKREKLLQAAAYLCKIDQFLRQALPEGVEGVRTFGRGEISSRAANQGRPR